MGVLGINGQEVVLEQGGITKLPHPEMVLERIPINEIWIKQGWELRIRNSSE
jgi:hypothetical protein